ncbi:uncharacterized protein VTP21DRAFT_6892 [Calcarisporiella thermophila]|uniref:uncharacterized protein n=1 Tax=Calcarisporiella thermophila TaxID=911321 RepID=UPI0037445769
MKDCQTLARIPQMISMKIEKQASGLNDLHVTHQMQRMGWKNGQMREGFPPGTLEVATECTIQRVHPRRPCFAAFSGLRIKQDAQWTRKQTCETIGRWPVDWKAREHDIAFARTLFCLLGGIALQRAIP